MLKRSRRRAFSSLSCAASAWALARAPLLLLWSGSLIRPFPDVLALHRNHFLALLELHCASLAFAALGGVQRQDSSAEVGDRMHVALQRIGVSK